MTREIYRNNKITEALCQFTFNKHLDTAKYERICEGISQKYTIKQAIPLIHFNFNLKDQTPEQIKLNGWRVNNSEQTKIAQIFSDNISIHQVKHYQQWEDFEIDISYVLDALNSLGGAEVGRIDLRVINVFEFDSNVNIEDYFKVFVKVPNSLSQKSGYNFQIEQVFESSKKIGVVRGNYQEEGEKKKMILDLSYIDLFLEHGLATTETNKLLLSLQEGRDRLYDLFIKSVTDKLIALIK